MSALGATLGATGLDAAIKAAISHTLQNEVS